MKNKCFMKLAAVSLLVLFVLSLSVFSAFAAPDDGSGGEDQQVIDSGDQGQADDSGDVQQQDDGGDADTDSGYDSGDTDSGNTNENDSPNDTDGNGYGEIIDDAYDYYTYINGFFNDNDDSSTYSEPENLNNLPEVNDDEIQLATEDNFPDVAVSDATLTSGIIMWLCVAVGVSVVVGVMVSKRTRGRSA